MNAPSIVRRICCCVVFACAASSLSSAQVPVREPTQVIEAPPDPEPGSQPTVYFAHGIAQHRNTLLLTPASSRSGYIYTRSNAKEPWTYSAKLTLPDDVGGIYDVDLDANTAVITGALQDLALVYVFKRKAGVWRLIQTIAEPQSQPPAIAGMFGYRLALSGGTLAIPNFLAGSSKGVVYLFKRGESGRFEFQQEVGGAAEGDSFGYDVAIQRKTMLVSNYSDRVLVFRERASGWVQHDVLLPPSDPAPYSFGTNLALDGNTAVVSSPWGDAQTQPFWKNGAVYVYRRTNGQWTFEAKLLDPFAYEGTFGEFVAVEGNKIAANAWGGRTTDRILIFERLNGQWTPAEMLLAPQSGYGFGYTLRWSGKDLLTSANSIPTEHPIFEGQVFHYVIPRHGYAD